MLERQKQLTVTNTQAYSELGPHIYVLIGKEWWILRIGAWARLSYHYSSMNVYVATGSVVPKITRVRLWFSVQRNLQLISVIATKRPSAVWDTI